AAVIYQTPHSADAALYPAQCPQLQPRWRELPARLIDIGFWGRWWVLTARLRHYDINEDDFASLPPQLRRLELQQLRSHR
ncbi:TIM29 translocase, partial [Chordeiles acutipennis]|nr:TIM29 translocase [Chordeiles acutipennis]